MALDFSKFGTPVEQSSALDFAKFGTPVEPPPPTTGAFAAGVKSYLPQVQETFGGLKTLLGVGAERVLGEGQISRGLIESGAASMKEAEAKRQPYMTAERGSFTDALNKGVGAVLTEWLPFQAGSGAAQVVEALALVGAGGLAGTMTAPGPGTLAGAGTGLVARELAKRGVKEAAEKILKERGEDAAKVYFEKAAKDVALDIGKKRGQTAALAGQAAFYGTGQTTSRAVEEAEKLGGTATDIELARVLPAAAVSTVAEFIGDKIALGALKGIKPGEPGKFVAADLAKNILLNIGLTGTKEVPVEVIQSAAERFGAKLSLTDAQALKEYIDATAASYGMAVGPGGVGGVRQTMTERELAKDKREQAEIDRLKEEVSNKLKLLQPEAPPVAPEATPEKVLQRVEEVTGVNRAAPPSAEESVLGRLYKLDDAEAEAAREELAQQRLLRQQEQVDAEAERIAELNRKQGMPSPDRPKLEIEERPSIAEAPPELTPREDLLAKQAEVDRRRLEAGLPTGEASTTPGVQPTPEVAEEPKPVPKIVDERPLTERASQNRLLVMRNMLQNQGGDPQSLTIVPHPTVEGKFAIQSLDVPTKLTPDLPRTAITRPETPTIIDPVNAYVEIQRRTNTPAARRFVQEYEAGRITREDVERAIEQEQKAGQPQPLTYTATGAPGIVAPEVSKPRGEREVPKLGETPPKVESEPPVEEPPGEEPPTPKATLPQTLEEFEARMPVVFDKAEVREANNQGNFAQLAKALQLSPNPAIRRIGQLGAGIASKITLRKPGKLGRGVAGVYRYADDSIQMIPSYAGDEHVNAHETLHALISKAQRFPTDRQKPVVQQIDRLFEHVKKELKKKGITVKEAYGLTNAREFTAEAMTNPKFQYELMQIPYPGKKSSWTQFVRLVADLLGIQNTNALTEVMNLVDRLATQKQPRKTVTDKGLTDETEAPAQERKSLGGAKAQQSNFEQTLRTLLNKFGLKDVGLSIIEGMQDAGSYAQQLIRIADRADNPIRTLRHEAIHALRELGFFTDAQWKSLSKMAKDKWIDQYLKQRNVDGKPLKAGEESRYDAYMREYNGDMEKITEEAVADAFADFDASKPPAGLLQALLKRMKDLFQSIKSALTKVESVDQIFGKVEEGKLKPGEKAESGERKSVRDRATANFLRWFGESKAVNEKGEPLVVYHGTNKDISTFKPGRGGGAIWFASKPELANLFVAGGRRSMGEGAKKGSAVYPVYLSIKKPLNLGSTSPQDNLSVADVLRMAKLPADQEALKNIAQANLSSGYAFVSPSNPDPVGYLANEYSRFNSRASNTLDDPGLMAALREAGYDGLRMKEEGGVTYAAFRPEQIKSAIGNNGDYSLTNADIRKSIGGVSPGQKALETIRSMGMDVKPPEPGTFKKIQKALTDAGENPAGTKESAKKALIKFGDWFETTVFSGDAAWSNTIHRSVIKDMKENEEVLGKLLEIRQSQTVNADNVVSRGLIEGTIEYDDETKKHQSVKKEENFAALAKKLDELATKYGLTKEQMERIAHTYLVAKRLPGIIKRNEELDAEIKAEEATAKPDRKSIDKWKSLKVFVSPQQEAMVEPGLSLLKDIPELSQIPKMINEIRKNHITFMVDSGLWSAEYAQAMWDNIDWVPFYREEQLEADAGPQEVIRGLQVKSKEFQLKGSEAAVNDVFENMMLWSQYAMNRGIRADKARRMIDVAKDIDVGDRKMAVQVTEEKRGMNIVRIYRDGKQELWDVADPMFMDAFASIQNVSMPMFKWAAKMADILRNSVVLYPLFSVAQVPQDSFAAMYTSGLKPQYALRIPILAVKEFIKTLNKTSATHNELVKYGVVGARTFNAEVMRKDAEIFAGMKPPKGGWNKTKDFLEHIAMSADNAVRQAVYEAARQQGVSKAEALEKAFEIFNVRRRGTSKALNLAGQTIPFFYAYLAAQRVAYQTITGAGTSPTERKAALQTLAATSAAVFTLSLLYAMLVAEDEDYADTPAPVRDRTLTIPGTGGVRIPLRPDFFLLPKIVAEHTYLMLTDQGYQDGAKFRRSMRDGLVNAIASPTPLPQIAKPALEVAINYSFFDGKPVVGTFEKQKDLERQFNDSTSEFSKLLGKTGLVSPIAADHLIRGMLGSAGGLALYGTNFVLHSDPDVPRPELSWKEAAAALPGTSGFLKRPQESALKNDFYTLRDEVEKAVNTFNDIKTRSPQGMEDFLADEKQMARYMLGKPVDQINQRLSKIRRQMTIITNMPESQMSAEDKAENIRQLREFEREYLKSVDVKALREMAKI
jgi:hypothetical protein